LILKNYVVGNLKLQLQRKENDLFRVSNVSDHHSKDHNKSTLQERNNQLELEVQNLENKLMKREEQLLELLQKLGIRGRK
jgi:predicted  nucleic acid-binding Zn-ribbon protein